MIKYFTCLVFVLFVGLFVAGISKVSAVCTTSENGWITCETFGGADVRATTCDQLSGQGTETCGAGWMWADGVLQLCQSGKLPRRRQYSLWQ